MSQLVAYVNRIARNEEGQDLLEYALLVALIALVAIAAVAAAGGRGERDLPGDRRRARRRSVRLMSRNHRGVGERSASGLANAAPLDGSRTTPRSEHADRTFVHSPTGFRRTEEGQDLSSTACSRH